MGGMQPIRQQLHVPCTGRRRVVQAPQVHVPLCLSHLHACKVCRWTTSVGLQEYAGHKLSGAAIDAMLTKATQGQFLGRPVGLSAQLRAQMPDGAADMAPAAAVLHLRHLYNAPSVSAGRGGAAKAAGVAAVVVVWQPSCCLGSWPQNGLPCAPSQHL